MKFSPTLKSWLGGLLILAGVLLALALSASITWGESEAGLYTSFNGDRNLKLKCPRMLAPSETGTITAVIKNLVDEEITPTVSAQISHAGTPRRTNQIVTLKSDDSKTLAWSIDSSDVIYRHLILVNILQSRYRDNPSMLGSCGILLFSLFGLSGLASYSLLMILSLAAMLLGAILWVQAHPTFDIYSINLRRAGIVLMVITTLALLSTLPRWWWLTLVLDAGIVLMIGIIFTEFFMLPQKKI